MLKVIKTDADYEAVLSEIDALMEQDPDHGTPEADRLALLTLLVEDYESKLFGATLPDPMEAIKFRMEQQKLTHRDLVPYIGTRSKVSEVLSGKRPLTLAMIRALHSGLGIPAEVLLQEKDLSQLEEIDIEWSRFPIPEMKERGWIDADLSYWRDQAEEILLPFFAKLESTRAVAALLRRTDTVRSARSMDRYALLAWTIRVIIRAREDAPPVQYKAGTVGFQFMRNVARLSPSDDGPLLARDFLRNHGIALVVEPHLRRTHLDGAAIMLQGGGPIIGLTLRHDRADNFWFCLMHELAHISLHFGKGITQFYDDLDAESGDDPREEEGDHLGREVLIPNDAWEKSAASSLRSPDAAEKLARELSIHPAIVAGRMRYEFKTYRLLSNLVGHRQVRRLFPEINWGK